MGPRARARGNMRRPSGPRCCSELQWGRERALAEISSKGSTARRIGLLQWGRERALAEITWLRRSAGILPGASMGPRARARGNEETTLPPRRARELQWGRERALAEIKSKWRLEARNSGASMGPRARARGNVACLLLLWFGRYASMGPRARARGNNPQRHSTLCQVNGFNGAASARSRKCL